MQSATAALQGSPVLIRVKVYANAIYLYGTNRLTARETFTGVASGYYEPVEKYAAQTFTQYDIDTAYANGWLTEQEYQETLAYKTNV